METSNNQTGAAIAKTTSFLDTFFNQGYNKLKMAAEAVELDKLAQEAGLGPITPELTADRVKTILAGLAMYSMLQKAKLHIFKLALLGGGGYMLMKNKEDIMALFNKDAYTAKKIAEKDPELLVNALQQNEGMGRY